MENNQDNNQPTVTKKLRGLANADQETRLRTARAGGRAVAQKPGHMRELGKKGAAALIAKHGREHMAKIGKGGGKAVVERYGRTYMADLGQQGGLAKGRK